MTASRRPIAPARVTLIDGCEANVLAALGDDDDAVQMAGTVCNMDIGHLVKDIEWDPDCTLPKDVFEHWIAA